MLATKVHGRTWPGENGRGLGRKHVLASIDFSLQRLGLDYVDLYQIHRWDYDTPIEETMEALNDVVRAGKARYIGASSMYAWQFAKAQAVAERNGWTRFVSMQNHYNLIYREEEREMIPQCIDQRRRAAARGARWRAASSPATAAICTERRTTRAQTDPFADSLYVPELDVPVVERLNQVAEARGVPSAQVALAWVLGKPGVTAPIVGATKLAHVEDALAAEELRLFEDEVASLEEPYVPHGISGHQ